MFVYFFYHENYTWVSYKIGLAVTWNHAVYIVFNPLSSLYFGSVRR